MKVKDQFLSLGYFKVNTGSQTWFWEDVWRGNQPLKLKFPSLFNIVRRKQDTVAAILNSTPLNVSFRRALRGQNLNSWNRIVSSIADLQLSEDPDIFHWSLDSSGHFSVKSIYAALVKNGVTVSQDIWRAKLPTKIKVFMWYLKKRVILTKDNSG